MKTTLIVIGKTGNKNFTAAINDYAERISHYVPFECTAIPDVRNNKNMTREQQKTKEGESIIKELQPGDTVVLLDEGGKEFSSTEFAAWFRKKANTVPKRLVFVIGGPYGFSKDVYAAANEKLSLSRMTFTHEMARLIFVEQLYRALDLLNGGPYHHG